MTSDGLFEESAPAPPVEQAVTPSSVIAVEMAMIFRVVNLIVGVFVNFIVGSFLNLIVVFLVCELVRLLHAPELDRSHNLFADKGNRYHDG